MKHTFLLQIQSQTTYVLLRVNGWFTNYADSQSVQNYKCFRVDIFVENVIKAFDFCKIPFNIFKKNRFLPVEKQNFLISGIFKANN